MKKLGMCWECDTKPDKDGYCRRKWPVQGERREHRIAWVETYGPIPKDVSVLHKCDNPICVRPTHLFLGTPYDNSKDMVYKGRQAKHEKNGQAKLTTKQVEQIRTQVQNGERLQTVADRFGISKGHASNITRLYGYHWK